MSKTKLKLGRHVTSYSEMGLACYGNTGKFTVDFFVMIAQIGIGIGYLIFNGTQINQVICYETHGEVCGYKTQYICIAVLILIPILWVKSLKKLSFVSMIALAFMIFALAVIMYYNF